MITYAVERWQDCWREMEPLWREHWREVALDHEKVPLDPRIKMYEAMQNAGALQVLIVRQRGSVIGYHIAKIEPHLHYGSTLHAFTDVYYIKPDCRRMPTVGVRLFREAHRCLKARGVKKIYTASKAFTISPVTGKSLDMAAIFESEGMRPTEVVYTKLL